MVRALTLISDDHIYLYQTERPMRDNNFVIMLSICVETRTDHILGQISPEF